MGKTLADCVAKIETVVTTATGYGAVTRAQTDNLSPAPFVMAFPSRGTVTVGTMLKKTLHTITCGIYVPELDYPHYRSALIAAIELVTAALNTDPTLAGTCDTITDITYTYGSSNYGSAGVWGVTFSIEVKIQ
jgi:hypothetical protein